MKRIGKAIVDYAKANLEIASTKRKIKEVQASRQAMMRAERGGAVAGLSSRAAAHIAEHGTSTTPRRRK